MTSLIMQIIFFRLLRSLILKLSILKLSDVVGGCNKPIGAFGSSYLFCEKNLGEKKLIVDFEHDITCSNFNRKFSMKKKNLLAFLIELCFKEQLKNVQYLFTNVSDGPDTKNVSKKFDNYTSQLPSKVSKYNKIYRFIGKVLQSICQMLGILYEDWLRKLRVIE